MLTKEIKKYIRRIDLWTHFYKKCKISFVVMKVDSNLKVSGKMPPGKKPPGKMPPRKLPPGNKPPPPPRKLPLGKMPPGKMPPQENCFNRFLLLLTLS